MLVAAINDDRGARSLAEEMEDEARARQVADFHDLIDPKRSSVAWMPTPDTLDDALFSDKAMRAVKSLQRDIGFPSFSTFMRAEFQDVKRREKHYHCRCPKCEYL